VSKRANYGFEKRQKELNRQKKKAEKAARKQLKKELAARDGQVADTPQADEDASHRDVPSDE